MENGGMLLTVYFTHESISHIAEIVSVNKYQLREQVWALLENKVKAVMWKGLLGEDRWLTVKRFKVFWLLCNEIRTFGN